MKEKQFGSLEIMIITKRKVNVQTVQAKKRNGMIGKSIIIFMVVSYCMVSNWLFSGQLTTPPLPPLP